MELPELCDRLDEQLRVDAFADIDASANGLQVGPQQAEIDHVALAVDAAVATIEEAATLNADLLLVHHGLSWGGFERVTDRTYERIAPLIDNDIALYAAHLPLDGHQQLGNAAGVADRLGLVDRAPFGSVGTERIGQRGRLQEPVPTEELADRLTTLENERVQTLPFGPEPIERVAIVTGSGVDWIDEASNVGVDALITGEGKQQAYHEAKESSLTVFLAGHYATETFGVRALGSLLNRWGIETSFIDHPTGL
ncbi:Nif3-like dinuclear metal center hexameric protein [Halocatena pleomorpha]|uniref:Nif3-like dinuclear metal center hexameric protein n=1 Tax=Halocatena pleomorpha TaxID=1785090 RepID=A0A3P3RF94_9EURY|nr:Nif3-like dinuclear metal center hexameric protein [Halocatena pleomorpha]RRJ32196.1 Nif3-like dinuclear metal center hexameric protein [Halocatena pleomorpha]